MERLGPYCHQSRHRRTLQHRLANSRVTSTMKQIPTSWAVFNPLSRQLHRPGSLSDGLIHRLKSPNDSNPPIHSLRNSRHLPSPSCPSSSQRHSISENSTCTSWNATNTATFMGMVNNVIRMLDKRSPHSSAHLVQRQLLPIGGTARFVTTYLRQHSLFQCQPYSHPQRITL